jgi:hypothetical protein
MVTQDTTFETLHVKQKLTGLYRALAFLFSPKRVVLPLVVAGETSCGQGQTRHCGQVALKSKLYTHVKNEFRESICSCTGTLPNHGVKFTQRASGSTGTPGLLPVTIAVSQSKSIFSSNGTSDYRAEVERFLRNRNQIKFRDHQGSNHSALLAWLKPNLAMSKARAGAVVSIKIREIILRRLQGFSTKKFT